MGMFDNLEVETGLELQEDKIGGVFAKIDHTGYYGMTIEKAYADVSTGGAFSITIHMKSDEGAFFTMTEYITSGTAKGCKNYYLDKDGNKQYLPGYNKIKTLDSLLGGSAPYPKTEKKTINLWDRDVSKELPTEKEVITSWTGKKIGVLIAKGLEDKYNDEYNFRETYEVQHFLEYTTNLTRNEKTAGTSGFKSKWLEANPIDKVYDRRKKSKGASIPSNSNTNDSNDGDEEDPFSF